jgi:hypothetical protein
LNQWEVPVRIGNPIKYKGSQRTKQSQCRQVPTELAYLNSVLNDRDGEQLGTACVVMSSLVDDVLIPLGQNALNVFLLDLGVLYPLQVTDSIPEIKVMLQGTKTLKTLSFCTNQDGNGGVICLAETSSEQANEFFEALELNNSVHSLNFERCSFEDRHMVNLMECLRRNRKLRNLNLTVNDFERVDHLAELISERQCQLQVLNLSYNEFVVRGWNLFANALAINRSLIRLSLRCTNIGAKDFTLLAEAMETNEHLSYLDFSSNNLENLTTEKVIMKMIGRNKGLLKLDLFYNQLPGEAFQGLGSALQENTTLETLIIGKNPEFGLKGTMALADGLKKNRTLTALEIDSTNMADDSAKVLFQALESETVAVRYLSLYDNELTDLGLTSVSGFLSSPECSLEYLAIGRNSFSVMDTLMEILILNSSLKYLNLRKTELNAKSLCLLTTAVNQNGYIGLELDECSIEDDGALELALMVRSKNKLRYFSVQSNKLTAKGFGELMEAFKTNDTVEMLMLCDNAVGEPADIALGEMLKINETLMHLYANEMGMKRAKTVCEGIAVHPNLTSCFLQDNKFSDEEADHFVQAIEKTTSLFALWIDSNQFSAESARKFEKAMKSNFTILRSVHSDRSDNNSFCLPSILRNQSISLMNQRISLLFWLNQQFQMRSSLVDIKQFYCEIWKYHDLPVAIDFRVPNFMPLE